MQSKQFKTALVVVTVAGLALGGVVAAGAGPDASTGGNERSPISLSASGQVEAQPDQAVVRVTIEAVARDPETARNRVATNASALLDRLKTVGLAEDQIRTRGYGIRKIEPDDDHDDDEHLPTPAYRARHTLAIEVDNLDRVGEVVTEATDVGGATVGGVRYKISREKRKQLKQKAIQRAMKQAEAKARTIASEGQMRIVGIASVSTQRVAVPTFRYREVAYASDAAGRPAQVETKVQSGAKTVTARVSVTFNATNTR